MFRNGYRPTAILDAYPVEKNIWGVPVLKFGDSEVDSDLPIIVTILGYQGVIESLKQAGFLDIVETKDAFQLFPKAIRYLAKCGFMWMKPDAEVDSTAVKKLKTLLADQRSKDTLTKIINFRLAPSAENYLWPEEYEMYFPPNIPRLYEDTSIDYIDCGAYDGDSLAGLMQYYKGEISSYLGIDLSAKNLQSLKKRLAQNAWQIGEVKLIQAALSSSEGGYLKVFENGAASYTIDSATSKADTVPVVTLDSLVKKVHNPFLKMDIEGADFDALLGAKKLIKTYRPNMSLSLYHCPEDLWRIPLYIESLVSGKYDFYLRQEGHWGLETTLYVVRK